MLYLFFVLSCSCMLLRRYVRLLCPQPFALLKLWFIVRSWAKGELFFFPDKCFGVCIIYPLANTVCRMRHTDRDVIVCSWFLESNSATTIVWCAIHGETPARTRDMFVSIRSNRWFSRAGLVTILTHSNVVARVLQGSSVGVVVIGVFQQLLLI